MRVCVWCVCVCVHCVCVCVCVCVRDVERDGSEEKEMRSLFPVFKGLKNILMVEKKKPQSPVRAS